MWLFEAIGETYLPLLRVLNALKKEEIPFRITLSMSPTLCAMLTDELLQQRYISHCTRMLDLADHELQRTAGDPRFQPLALAYRDLHARNLSDFTQIYKKNITRGFRSLAKEGHLEIITTAATHSFLPLFQEQERAVEMQIQTGVISHGRTFGASPKGFWLPECGYYPGLDRHLKRNGIDYFFTAAHGILFADQRPRYGVYAPVVSPDGVAAFGRDTPSSQAVWSADEGYPGDFSYRDFYRDIGQDLSLDYLKPWILEDARVNTGFKYYAITGPGDEKMPYVPADAAKKVEEHAENFVYNRMKQIAKLNTLMDRPPIVVCPYDAELFGHWWYEGTAWLDALIRNLADHAESISMITPGDYLSAYPNNQTATPSVSSWGNNGYAEVWLGGSNDWIYRHLHKAIERMGELADRFPNEEGLKQRALNQAAREVLLSLASDWPFIMKTGTTVNYAQRRIKEHLKNFNSIFEGLRRNTVKTEWLTGVEKRNNLFSDIDYRGFASAGSFATRPYLRAPSSTV